MTLDFDIQGVLFPNLITMAVQLCATIVLFLLCKKLLWKPARAILKARQDKMNADLQDADKAQKEALSNLEEAKKELKEARARSGEIVENARKEADGLKNEIVASAKKEAAEKMANADRRIEAKKKELQDDLHDQMVDVALAAVSKLLEEKSSSADDEKAIRKYLDEVEEKK